MRRRRSPRSLRRGGIALSMQPSISRRHCKLKYLFNESKQIQVRRLAPFFPKGQDDQPGWRISLGARVLAGEQMLR